MAPGSDLLSQSIYVMLLLVSLLVASQAAAATTNTREDKNRPVTKVINLLKDMKAQLEKEAVEDEEVYEKARLVFRGSEAFCW